MKHSMQWRMWLAMVGLLAISSLAKAQEPVKVAVIGLEHSHAMGVFDAIANNHDVKLVAIVEPDTGLRAKYGTRFHLDPALFVDSMDALLADSKPDVVLVYTSILRHRAIVVQAAEHGVSAMVEKPLATTLEDAVAMREAARKHHTQLLVNYETTWYASNAYVMQQAAEGKLGPVRKVIVRDGHQGPQEIGVPPEFLTWLTDPVKNGAGAMFDFGCYGADLMTVIMHGEAPLSVTAVAQTDKPEIYPNVDDDATIVLRYNGAQAVLLPSWNWPISVKNMEVYGATSYETAVNATRVETRTRKDKEDVASDAPPLPPDEASALGYLVGVMRGRVKPQGDLSALDTNMVVMQILDAARRSATEGRTVEVTPLPK
jgi:glucose-fructose oxidoreductase